jgi:Trypsin-like peptidase domain
MLEFLFGPKLPDWAARSGHKGRTLERLWRAVEQHVVAAKGQSKRREQWLDVRTADGRDVSIDMAKLAYRHAPTLEKSWPVLVEISLASTVPSARVSADRLALAEEFLRARISQIRAAAKDPEKLAALYRTRVRPETSVFPAPLKELAQVAAPFAPGLVQILEYGLLEAIPFVHGADLAADASALLQRGVENALLDPVKTSEERLGEASFIKLQSRDAAASARLLRLEMLGPIPPRGAFVAAPIEGELYFHAIEDQSAWEGLRGVALATHQAWWKPKGPRLLDDVFWYRGGQLLPLNLLWRSVGAEPFVVSAHEAELHAALADLPAPAPRSQRPAPAEAPPSSTAAPDQPRAPIEPTSYRPVFKTKRGTFDAGTAFVLACPGRDYDLGITCQHLLGPAGGLPFQLDAREIAQLVTKVTLREHGTKRGVTRQGTILSPAAADAADPLLDLVAIHVFRPHEAHVFRLAERDAQVGDEVSLIGKVREGAPPEQRRHVGMIAAVGDAGIPVVIFEGEDVLYGGTSGAPVVNADGAVVGMVVRAFGEGGRGPVGILPVERLRALLRPEIPGWQG